MQGIGQAAHILKIGDGHSVYVCITERCAWDNMVVYVCITVRGTIR